MKASFVFAIESKIEACQMLRQAKMADGQNHIKGMLYNFPPLFFSITTLPTLQTAFNLFLEFSWNFSMNSQQKYV